MKFFRHLQCMLFGHPGVFREWEWKPTAPLWKERQDAWTCIRCQSELIDIPVGKPSYMVTRPIMNATIIEHINKAVDEHGASSVRIRSGDPSILYSRTSV